MPQSARLPGRRRATSSESATRVLNPNTQLTRPPQSSLTPSATAACWCPGAAVFVIASKHYEGKLTSTRLYVEKDSIKYVEKDGISFSLLLALFGLDFFAMAQDCEPLKP